MVCRDLLRSPFSIVGDSSSPGRSSSAGMDDRRRLNGSGAEPTPVSSIECRRFSISAPQSGDVLIWSSCDVSSSSGVLFVCSSYVSQSAVATLEFSEIGLDLLSTVSLSWPLSCVLSVLPISVCMWGEDVWDWFWLESCWVPCWVPCVLRPTISKEN